MIEIYTDGSCLENPGNGGWAAIINNDGKIKKEYLEQAISTLNDRERTIIKLRKLRDKSITLDELGQMLKISKERVRQIETKALEKLKTTIVEISQQNKEFFI